MLQKKVHSFTPHTWTCSTYEFSRIPCLKLNLHVAYLCVEKAARDAWSTFSAEISAFHIANFNNETNDIKTHEGLNGGLGSPGLGVPTGSLAASRLGAPEGLVRKTFGSAD